MRSTTLFGIYAVVLVGLIGGLAGLTLYSLEKSRWWDARTQLAHESFGLHLRLQANLYRLFKQHGDALLIGDRDAGETERALRIAINQNLTEIRNVIGREIQMVGEEEIDRDLEVAQMLRQLFVRVDEACADGPLGTERFRRRRLRSDSLRCLQVWPQRSQPGRQRIERSGCLGQGALGRELSIAIAL